MVHYFLEQIEWGKKIKAYVNLLLFFGKFAHSLTRSLAELTPVSAKCSL